MKKKLSLNVFKGMTALEVLVEIWSVFWRSLMICLCTMLVREVYSRFQGFDPNAPHSKILVYWMCFAALATVVYVLVAFVFLRRAENRRFENRKDPGLFYAFPRMLGRIWVYQEVISLIMLVVMIFEGIPGTSLDADGRLVTEVTACGYFMAQLGFVVISRSFVIGAIAHAAFSGAIIFLYYSCFSRFADKKNLPPRPAVAVAEETAEEA